MGTVARQEQQARFGGGGGIPVDGYGDYGRQFPPGHSRRVYRTGMYLVLVGVTTLFVAFTSAYIVRKGMGDDWVPLTLPRLIWWNTAMLLLSSFTMEQTRRTLNAGLRAA